MLFADSKRLHLCYCCATVLIGRIIGVARPSVCFLSLSLCPVRAPNLNTKRREKSIIGGNVPQTISNRCARFQLILHITIPEMHHNNMSIGSSLWHFLYRLVHKFIRSVVSSEKEVATT